MAVGAQGGPPDPRFGAVEAFWDPQAAADAGVGWERILFYWSQLQPGGPDDWNTLHVPDEWLQTAQAQGREVVGLLKNTPAWAADADQPLEASPPRGLDLPLDDPGNVWAAFVRRAAGYYGPRGVHRWIIWNEPDIAAGTYGEEWHGTAEQYYRLLKVAYLAIKQVDPEARIHLAGVTYWHDPGWLRRFLAIAAADPEAPAHNFFFDVASLHIYFQTDTVDYIVNETRAALNATGMSKPIWINETNASPDEDPQWPVVRPRWRVDLREQASFILQAYALGLAAGAERIAVYKLMDAGLPAGGEPFGLLRPDHSRRPAFDAYQLAIRQYAGTGSARAARDPLWAQVTLNQGGRTTRVLWARTAAGASLVVPVLAQQAVLYAQDGSFQTLDGSSGSYLIQLEGARCADPYAGCFIGGPTVLLVEEAPAGNVGVPALNQPTQEAVTAAPSSAAGESAAEMTPSPTTTPSPEPTPTFTETPALIATSSSTPSPTLVIATASPSPAATATSWASPTPNAAAGNATDRRPVFGWALALVALAAAGVLGWLWLRSGRR